MSDQFDRLPPHSIETEMCLIASVMLAANRRDVIAETLAVVRPDDFFQGDHQIIFSALAEMYRRGEPIDPMLVRERLIRNGTLESVGGVDYLAQIINSVPNYANAVHYAGIVREKSVLRQLIAISNDAIRAAYGHSKEDRSAALCRKYADAAAGLAASGMTDSVVTLGEASMAVVDRQNGAEIRRIPTGIMGIDNVIGGLAKSKFVLVGADPRVGKSTLIKQILLNLSRAGVKCGLITVEEDHGKVAENMLANKTGLPNHKIAQGKLSQAEWGEVGKASASFLPLPYLIDDGQSRLEDVVAAIERMKTKHGCEVVAVDHLHLITADASSPEQEVSKVSKGLKAVYKRCDLAGMVACQLNRGADAKQKPTIRSLRGSGSLEADGDLVMLLYREDVVRYTEPGYEPTRIIEVNFAKNKDGRMGEVPLEFLAESQYVGDITPTDPFA